MNQTEILLIIFITLVVAAAFLFLWRRRGASDQSAAVETDGQASAERIVESAAAAPIAEGHGVSDGVAAAIEDVADQFLGVDSHPSMPPPAGPADPLTQIKGLGPKAQAQLNVLGIQRYDQLATLNDAQVAAIDAGMGAFKGRILKDKWVDQAQHLAAGDKAGFEAKYGKLGG